MDIILFILVICFRGSSEKHSYTAINILSIIGAILLFLLRNSILNWWISFIVYIVILILGITAKNKK